MNEGLHYEIEQMEAYAKEHNVPIMEKESLTYLLTFLDRHHIKSVLEVGTAIGYSAIQMALAIPGLTITTIERDEERYLEAIKNIKKCHLEDRITLVFSDALETRIEGTFDLIFLDAAKAQNIHFFERFENNLNPHGFYVTDNIEFHGMVVQNESDIESRNVRGIVRKIKEYLNYLEEKKDYHTEFISVGDGLAISEKL